MAAVQNFTPVSRNCLLELFHDPYSFRILAEGTKTAADGPDGAPAMLILSRISFFRPQLHGDSIG